MVVLRPILGPSAKPSARCIPAWDAILLTQTSRATDYWLITQPDHAALSGAIAAALGPPLLPALDSEVVKGIAVHDDGWASLDAQVPSQDGRPRSFLEFSPRDFVRAWTGSIERAEKVAPIAGAIVSRHFWRLGKSRVKSSPDAAEDRGLLADFLEHEQARQNLLLGTRSRDEFEFLTDVLQFCDVLSLYLCCGATDNVEFPQTLGLKPIRLRREQSRPADQAATCRFEPSPFTAGGVDLAVMATRFPVKRQPSTMTLPFLLW